MPEKGNDEGKFDLLKWLADLAIPEVLEAWQLEAKAREAEAQERIAQLQTQAEAEKERMKLYLLLGAGALGLLFFYLQGRT